MGLQMIPEYCRQQKKEKKLKEKEEEAADRELLDYRMMGLGRRRRIESGRCRLAKGMSTLDFEQRGDP